MEGFEGGRVYDEPPKDNRTPEDIFPDLGRNPENDAGVGNKCDINELFNQYHEEERYDNDNCDPDGELDEAFEDLNS